MSEDSAGPVIIIGLGYVGTSLASILADEGFEVYGVDIDDTLVSAVNDGQCPIEEDTITPHFEEHVEAGRITATTSYDVVADSGTVIVTVGTPLDETDPDVSAVETATESIGHYLQEGQLVIYRSTLPATLTETVIAPLLESVSGLTPGVEFDLAFCPERMAEGTAYADLTTTPVVVGGLTAQSQSRTEAFWESLGLEVVSVSSPTAAEFTKLADNWWIDLNIALANEVALLSEELGVNASEVIHAANTLSKGEHHVNILYPGAGVGGSCLVKDPWFVANLGEKHGLELQTPRVSRQVNDQMPQHMVDLIKTGVGDLDGAVVAVLGYAFKAGTDDTRNTPAVEIINTLRDAGAEVRIADPYVGADTVEGEVSITPSRLPEALDDASAVAFVTGHDQYRSLSVARIEELLVESQATIVDGRDVFSSADFADSGIKYLGVGAGENRE